MESVHCVRDILTCLLCELGARRFVSGLAEGWRSVQLFLPLTHGPKQFYHKAGRLFCSR